jgi:two-component sensor histidine kinase
VRQLKSRIGGAALVYQVSEALQTDPVGIGQVIRMIATALKNMYRPWKRITLTVTGGDVDLPIAIAAPVAMMVNELVTNCFKHAFPDNHYGTIDVGYEDAQRAFALTVSDNGVGFSADQQGGRMGRAAIEQMVQGLAGTVEWQSSTAGTHVRIHIPVADTTVSPEPAAAPM